MTEKTLMIGNGIAFVFSLINSFMFMFQFLKYWK